MVSQDSSTFSAFSEVTLNGICTKINIYIDIPNLQEVELTQPFQCTTIFHINSIAYFFSVRAIRR